MLDTKFTNIRNGTLNTKTYMNQVLGVINPKQ